MKIFKEKINCEIVKSLYEKYNVDLNINHHLQMVAINIYYKYGYKLDLIKILSMIVVSELVSLLKILNKPINGFKYNIKIGIKNYLKEINEKEKIHSLLNELYDRKTEESLFVEKCKIIADEMLYNNIMEQTKELLEEANTINKAMENFKDKSDSVSFETLNEEKVDKFDSKSDDAFQNVFLNETNVDEEFDFDLKKDKVFAEILHYLKLYRPDIRG